MHELDAYWAMLEHLAVHGGGVAKRLYPLNHPALKRLSSQHSWSALGLMRLTQWDKLWASFKQQLAEGKPIDWFRCLNLSRRLKLNYHEVRARMEPEWGRGRRDEQRRGGGGSRWHLLMSCHAWPVRVHTAENPRLVIFCKIS